MSANFLPEQSTYYELKPFRFWCQKVMPLAYDDSLSYYEVLCKLTDYMNKAMEDTELMADDITKMYEAYGQLEAYVNNYFDSLEVQEKIDAKLDEMAEDGTLTRMIEPFIPDIVTNWLNNHVTPTSPVVDESLTISGAAADAKIVGDNAFIYRGDMNTLGYTTFAECTKPGNYRFSTAYVSSIEDKPSNLSSGGMLSHYRGFAGTSWLNIIVDTNFRVWYQYTNSQWYTADANYFMNRGNMSDLEKTSFGSCSEAGYYAFSQAYGQTITDKPAGMTTGGGVITFTKYANNAQFQWLFTVDGAMWCRVGSNPFVQITAGGDTSGFLKYNGNMSTLHATTFYECNETGYYNFGLAYLSSITDKPEELSTGGVMFNLNNFGGGVRYQLIIDTYGGMYARHGSNKFYHINAETPVYRPTWENGVIVASTGAIQESTTRIVSNVIPLGTIGGVRLDYDDTKYKVMVAYYKDGVHARTYGWTDAIISGGIPSGFYIRRSRDWNQARLCVAYLNNASISPSIGNSDAINPVAPFSRNPGPVWRALGDSISYGYCSNADSTLFTSPFNYTNLGAELAGVDVIMDGNPGAGWLVDGTTEISDQTAKEQIDNTDFSGCDLVTLAFGVNDWKGGSALGTVSDATTAQTVCGVMKHCIEKILDDEPLCQVVLISPFNSRGYAASWASMSKANNYGIGYAFSASSGTLEDMYQAYKDIADYYGLKLIDFTHDSVVNRENLESVLPDGVHPSYGCQIAQAHRFATEIPIR